MYFFCRKEYTRKPLHYIFEAPFMKLLWKYLRPHSRYIFIALLLAGTAQLLIMMDPIIFGKIIDDYTGERNTLTENERIRGVLFWLSPASSPNRYVTSSS